MNVFILTGASLAVLCALLAKASTEPPCWRQASGRCCGRRRHRARASNSLCTGDDGRATLLTGNLNQTWHTDSDFRLDVARARAEGGAMLEANDQLIRLQAVDMARNIARCYEIHAQRDLFGAIVVEYSWGRIGAAGQSRRVSFDNDDQGGRFIRQLLARRGTAIARIGVAYTRI